MCDMDKELLNSIDSSIGYLLRIVVYLFIRSSFFYLFFSRYKSVKYSFSFENSWTLSRKR